jgi:surfeit locus 1 family protein
MMLRPRWVAALLLALAVAAGFALLGQWQLSRAIASGAVIERSTETVKALDDVVRPDSQTPQTATGQLVSVSGYFVAGDEPIIAERVNRGDVGYWVVSHFVSDAGPSIPVARGWAQDLSAAEREAEALTGSVADRVELTGRFLPSEAPEVPDAREDPLTMTTVSVGALINLWTETDDPSVYEGYITAATPPSGLTKIDSPPPEAEVTVNWLNIFYAGEWAIFAGFAVFLWYRLVKDAWEREQEAAEAAQRPVAPPTDP